MPVTKRVSGRRLRSPAARAGARPKGERGPAGEGGERGPQGKRDPAGERGPAGELSAEQARQLQALRRQMEEALNEPKVQFVRIAQMQAQLDSLLKR